jgi:hypothetical protein
LSLERAECKALATAEETFKATLSVNLALLCAGLKGAPAKDERAAVARTYEIVLKGQIEECWLEPTTEWYLRHSGGTWFPKAADFLETARTLRNEVAHQEALEAAARALREEDERRFREEIAPKYAHMSDQELREHFAKVSGLVGLQLSAGDERADRPDRTKRTDMGVEA